MKLSLLDIFKVGVGPSSSHTVGPMRAATRFAARLPSQTREVRVHLYGSLALTGRGHASDRAVLLGLQGVDPAELDPDQVTEFLARVPQTHRVFFHEQEELPEHPNGLRFEALGDEGQLLLEKTYYSIGGGQLREPGVREPEDTCEVPFAYRTADELLDCCSRNGLELWQIGLANEAARRPQAEIDFWLERLWAVMRDCVARGLGASGELPGGLQVQRRARDLSARIRADEALAPLDRVEAWAMAVSEENAAGGRVVTAPTNGAAGIVPAVALYYHHFCPGADDGGLKRFFLTAAVIGALYAENASISGAEVGCQGEVGVACSMAAAGLVAALGGGSACVEKAAEMAMEHHLGLTCDPVAGLVQIPCIERNALAAPQAILVARLALREGASHRVSLDQVMATMLQTGRDMSSRYKETSRGGLALSVPMC